MTNREWLATLSDEDFANWIYAERTYTYKSSKNGMEKIIFASSYSPCLEEVVMAYTSHIMRLQEWLSEERN